MRLDVRMEEIIGTIETLAVMMVVVMVEPLKVVEMGLE